MYKPMVSNPNKLTFGVMFMLLIIIRITTLLEFGTQFTGSDDLTFWQGAIDYSHGDFHEPFFYAQNYNLMLESFLAVPLLWMGVPVYIALPIISTLLGIFPFLVFSWVLFQKKWFFPSFIFLLIPICLPVEYDIMTSITRGFTSGLFFTGFLIYPILRPKDSKQFVVLGTVVALGYVFNPNSLIISFPVCLVLWIYNLKNPKFYLGFFLASIPIIAMKLFAESFYINNSDYLVHRMWKLKFNLIHFFDGFANLDKYFKYLMPVFWKGNWLVVFVIMGTGISIFRKNWTKGFSLVLAGLFIFILMGVNKVNDGKDVIFYSITRMFLAVPLLLSLAFFWWYQVNEKKWDRNGIILAISLSLFFVKVSIYPMVVKQHTTITNFGQVAIKPLDSLTKECVDIERLVKKHKIDFVVFVPWGKRNVPEIEFINYGCSSVTDVSFSSVMNIYERRTWVYLEEKNKTRKSFLLFNPNVSRLDSISQVMDCYLIQHDPNVVLLQNNSKSLEEIAKIFDFPFKRNVYY